MIRPLELKDWDWVTERIPLKQVEDTCGLVYEADGVLKAAVVFDSMMNNSAQMSTVIDSSMVLSDGFFDRVYSFAFNYLGKDRVYGYFHSDNKRSLATASTLGFKAKAVFEKAYNDTTDYILMELKQDDVVIPSFSKLGGKDA